jgi:hypothetical protein
LQSLLLVKLDQLLQQGQLWADAFNAQGLWLHQQARRAFCTELLCGCCRLLCAGSRFGWWQQLRAISASRVACGVMRNGVSTGTC